MSSEALRLADWLDKLDVRAPDKIVNCISAASLLRTQAASIAELEAERSGLNAARIAYASEFPVNEDGEPDTGSIHANIRALKAERDQLRAEVERLRKPLPADVVWNLWAAACKPERDTRALVEAFARAIEAAKAAGATPKEKP